MGISIQDRNLIDRFLQGELSGIELENFQLRMKEDAHFKSEVALQKMVYEGIKKANHQRLKKIIFSALNYRKPSVPYPLKMIIIFFLVTGFGITLWFYVGNESANKDQAKSWFAFLNSKKGEAVDKHELNAPREDLKQKPMQETDSSDNEPAAKPVQADSLEVKKEEAPVLDSAVMAARDEDIIVKQDQLLISATMPVENKTIDKEGAPEESLAEEAVQKLNPAADLPAVEKIPSNVTVEFWVSPINYRGYKMSKNKLILFGIEEPDAVKLYRVNDALYMVYLKEFYRLNDSFDFVSYQKLKDSEIPLAIK
jgi:hypothetical protein